MTQLQLRHAFVIRGRTPGHMTNQKTIVRHEARLIAQFKHRAEAKERHKRRFARLQPKRFAKQQAKIASKLAQEQHGQGPR